MIRLAAAILLFVLACAPAHAGRIELHTSARVPAGEPVMLEDVAELSGTAAVSLAYTEVLPALADRQRASVTAVDIRMALKDIDGVVWSELTLSGSACELIAIDAEALRTRSETRRASKPVANGSAQEDDAQAEPGTVRGSIRRYLAGVLGVAAEDLKLEFDPRDTDLLAESTTAGPLSAPRTVEIRAVGSSSRVPVSVTVYEGERIAAEGTTRVGVLVRRTALVAREPVRRGDPFDADRFAEAEHWLPPDRAPATDADLLHAKLRVGMDPGEVLLAKHLDAPPAIRRGERVVVRCLSGGVVIRTEAYALQGGREGERIRFRRVGADRSEPGFLARVEGRGRAVAATEGGRP